MKLLRHITETLGIAVFSMALPFLFRAADDTEKAVHRF
jgi:hypothetical protein